MATCSHPRSLAAFAFTPKLVLLYFLAASSLHGQTKPSDNTIIRGTVVNSLTHEPIGRALVYSPDNRFATMTDDRGHFQFNLVQPESQASYVVRNPFSNRPYTLMARKPGFLPPTNEQQASLVEEIPWEVIIPLVPEALIVGHVQIPGADRFDRIQVGLYRRTVREGRDHWDSAGIATSKSDGEFRFAELQPGSYKLVTHELLDRDPLNPRGALFGFPPVYYPSGTDFSTASIVPLTPGAIFVADISPVRREYYPVKIRVTNPPPASDGIGVQVWPQGHPGPGFALGYDPEEQAIRGSLPDGFYVLQVFSYGPNSVNGSANLSIKGAPAEGQTISLFPNVSIPVSIRHEFQRQETLAQLSTMGNPSAPNGWLRNVNVNLLPVEDFSVGGQPSTRHRQNPEDDSPPLLENVHPGRYRVIVNTPIGFAAAVTSGAVDLLNQPLVVSPGGAVAPIEITLRDDGADVDGVVEGTSSATGARPFLLQVYFIPSEANGRLYSTGSFSTDGRFQMQQLPPGAYRVIAFSRSLDLEYTNEDAMHKYDSKSVLIRLESGQKEHLRLQLTTPED